MQTLATSSPPTIQQRLLLHGAWTLTAAAFLSIGWAAVRPWDPCGPVSLLASDDPGRMVLAVLALAAVAAAMATVFAGRSYPDVGAFAVGLGLTAVSLRGQTMTYLLIQSDGRVQIILQLALESLFWFAVMLAAMICSAVVIRWMSPASRDEQCAVPSSGTGQQEAIHQMAVAGATRLIRGSKHGDGSADDWATGAKHVIFIVVVSLILIRIFLFSASGPDQAVRHGQACFAVAAAFYLAVGRAQASVPVNSTFWSCLAVPLVGLGAFCIALFMATRIAEDIPACVPASSFLRVLPVTYIALGTSATLLARWRAGAERGT